MKLFIALTALVAASNAWVLIPGDIPNLGGGISPIRPVPPSFLPHPEVLPPIVLPQPEVPQPLPPIVLPEPEPLPPSVLPELPEPLPPIIWPEIPAPELPVPPRPLPPTVHPEIHREVLNFPSNEDPQIRVHVAIKGYKGQAPVPEAGHKPGLPGVGNLPGLPGLPGLPRLFSDAWSSKPWIVEGSNKPVLPEVGQKPWEVEGINKPALPEMPEIGNKPALPELPSIPGVPQPPLLLPPSTLPEFPHMPQPEQDPSITYIYPDPEHQLVKLRVVYNLPEVSNDIPSLIPFNLRGPQIDPIFPGPGVDPIFPGVPPIQLPEVEPERPIIPMPPPTVEPPAKKPAVELFIDIGEPDRY